MVLFAAVTSAMSILEAVVSSMIDKFKVERHKATIIESLLALALAVVVCLGYNKWYFEVELPNTPEGGSAQILDIMDYVSNNILMPIVAIATCIMIGWVLKPKTVIDEVTKNGEKLGRRRLYVVMVQFLAPMLLVMLLVAAFGVTLEPVIVASVAVVVLIAMVIYYIIQEKRGKLPHYSQLDKE